MGQASGGDRSFTDSQSIVVFADGGAAGNPGPGGWGTIVLTPDGTVTELGGSAPHTTNNRMELTAVIAALRHLRRAPGKVTVYSDSTYVVRGMSAWIHAWKRRGWKTTEGGEVLNRELWEALDDLASERGSAGAITWRHVPGHAGIPGNERADAIASAHAAGRHPELYHGPLQDYPEDVLPLPEESDSPRPVATGSRKGRSKGAYSYLSVVDGKPMRHTTWTECERRVKGKSRALFKKAVSRQDEVEILRAWGFSLDDL